MTAAGPAVNILLAVISLLALLCLGVVMVNSAGGWGQSDPLAVPEFIFEMRSRGHDEALIRKIVYENPLAFFAQCARFSFAPRDAVVAETH